MRGFCEAPVAFPPTYRRRKIKEGAPILRRKDGDLADPRKVANGYITYVQKLAGGKEVTVAPEGEGGVGGGEAEGEGGSNSSSGGGGGVGGGSASPAPTNSPTKGGGTRVPSYTDRLLLRQPLLAGLAIRTTQAPSSTPAAVLLPQITCAAYDASDDLTLSDHMPVGAVWHLPLQGAVPCKQEPVVLPGCPLPAPPFPVVMPACLADGRITSPHHMAEEYPQMPLSNAQQTADSVVVAAAAAAAAAPAAPLPPQSDPSPPILLPKPTKDRPVISPRAPVPDTGGHSRGSRVAPLLAKPSLQPAHLITGLQARVDSSARLAVLLVQAKGEAPLLEAEEEAAAGGGGGGPEGPM